MSGEVISGFGSVRPQSVKGSTHPPSPQGWPGPAFPLTSPVIGLNPAESAGVPTLTVGSKIDDAVWVDVENSIVTSQFRELPSSRFRVCLFYR